MVRIRFRCLVRPFRSVNLQAHSPLFPIAGRIFNDQAKKIDDIYRCEG